MTFMIYMLGIVDNIISVSWIVIVLAMIAMFVCLILFVLAKNDDEEKIAKVALLFLKRSIVVLLISTVGGLFIPSSKTLAAMYLIPKMTDKATAIASHEKINQIPDKVLTILNGKLDQWINDVTKIKEKR